MTDEHRDVAAELEAWAAATDPAADPITAAEVRDAELPSVALPRGRSRLAKVAAVAAAIVVVGGGIVILGQGGDDADERTTTAGAEDEPRLQVVVVTEPSRVMGRPPPRVEAFALRPVCPEGGRCRYQQPVAAGPLEPGVMLAVDAAVAPGTYWFERILQECPDEGCGPPTPDGVLAGLDMQVGCRAEVTMGATDRRVVVRLDADAPSCTVDEREPPALTVPAAWSVRPALPWSCGAAAWDVNGQVAGSDPQGALATLGCLREAIADGRPVETRIAELQAGDGLTRSWLRVLPGPDPDRPLEVIRDMGLEGVTRWAVQRCEDVDVETSEDGQYVAARPSGCEEEEPLSLDLPSFDEPPPAPPATPSPAPSTQAQDDATELPSTTAGDPPAPGTIDVVLDGTDLPVGDGTKTWTWSVHLGDEEVSVATGTLAGAQEGGSGAPIALVADDLVVPDGTAWIGLQVDDGTGGGNLCLGGDRIDDDPGARIVVFHQADRACTPEWTTGIPPLTVPPAWSLREPATQCLDLPADARWNQCLVDADLAGTAVAEWTQPAVTMTTTYRVVRGVVTRVDRFVGPEGTSWTESTCDRFEIGQNDDGSPAIGLRDCGRGSQPMPYDA